MNTYVERARLSQALKQHNIEIDPGDHRPIEEIAEAFGILAVEAASVPVEGTQAEVL